MTTQETLYHPEVFLPDWFEMPSGVVVLEYSRHALKAAKDDRYGHISLPTRLDLSDFALVELGASGKRTSKIVVRGRYDETRDIVLVLCPGPIYFVKTVWFNLSTDNHKTLRKGRYAKR